MLDITEPSQEFINKNTFLVSSDVFEHVNPPAQRAFDGSYKCLERDGILILTLPYSLQTATVEHFPELHNFKILETTPNSFTLFNITRDGRSQKYENLCFHGGPGSTLEMRVFSLTDIINHLKTSGFDDIRIHDQDYPENGIIIKEKWSLPISAIKKCT